MFGCWTSVSRKSVLPVFKELELDPVLSRAIRGRGIASATSSTPAPRPTSRRFPAVDYLMSDDGGSVKRWVLEGTDYVYPRTTNKILDAYLKAKGVAPEDIMINYTPFGFSDWQTEVSEDQGVRLGGQEDGGGLDDQRRRQRALLQGARQPGRQGDRHSRRRVLGRRRRARRPRRQAAGRPSRRLELFPDDRHAGEQGVHREVARLHQEPEAHLQRSDGSARASASTCGSRRSRRPARSTRTR